MKEDKDKKSMHKKWKDGEISLKQRNLKNRIKTKLLR